jgi:hypothetical protein
VQREPQQAILTAGGKGFADLDGNVLGAVARIDAHDAPADALGDPQEVVRTPGDLPRSL